MNHLDGGVGVGWGRPTNSRQPDGEWLTLSPNTRILEVGSCCRWVNGTRGSVILLALCSGCSNLAAEAPGIASAFKAGRGRGRAGASCICPFYQENEHIPGNPTAQLATPVAERLSSF